MGKIRIALSFDDGRKDNFRIAKDVLKKYNIPATFNITTSYVEKNIAEDQAPCKNQAMSVDEVISLHNMGFEIAGHGDCHQNTIDDIMRGIEKIRGWIPDTYKKIGFASPNSLISKELIVSQEAKLKNMGINYVRIGLRHPSGFIGLSGTIRRKMAALTKNNTLYVSSFKDSLLETSDIFILQSIPIMHSATLKQVKYLVDFALKVDKSLIFMFHSIVKKGEEYYNDTWSWDYDDFVQLCKYIKQNEAIEVCAVDNMLGGNNLCF